MNFAGPKRRGGIPKKYHLTDEARALILREYRSNNRRELAARIGVPAWCVSRWAGELGVRRMKERPWSEEEIALLRKYAYSRGWTWLAKKTGRTVCAVKLKAKRLRVHKIVGHGYTMRMLAELLGVDDHKVGRWIRDRKLHASRRQTDRVKVQGGDAYLITERAARNFIRDHPEEIDLRVVDKLWFIDLAFGTNASGYRAESDAA